MRPRAWTRRRWGTMPSRGPCLAIIPAKGNSRRLPGKNFRQCGGMYLTRRAIVTAESSGIFKVILVSTEQENIPEGLEDHAIHREPILTADGVTTAMVCLDVLSRVRYAFPSFCLLVPTSPLRTPETLRAMWERFCLGAPELMSVESDPNELGFRHEGTAIFCDTLEFVKRRDFYHPEGDIFQVPPEEICDVNTAADLARAEEMLAAREHTKEKAE